MAKDKRLWIDMCAGSQLKDIQGETLSVEGCDIRDLERGVGRLNDNHSSSFYGSLGRVTEAKKIFSLEDCENDRHRYYWEKIKAPYVYVKGFLYNDEDHPNARAAAAIMRNIYKDDCPLKLKASVEGGVLARGIKDPTHLARTKIHSVALTFVPANNATLVEPLNIDKTDTNWKADKQLIKSVQYLSETNVPSFRHITRHASAHTIYENINKITELAKSVGIEIEVKDLHPEQIMERAVMNKIASNVSKINNIVKALTPTKPVGGSQVRTDADDARTGRSTARDQFQQDIGKLKSTGATPAKPKDTATGSNMKTQSADKVKHTNTLKTHASRAMKDQNYLTNLHSQLTDHGVHPDKISQVISSVKSHMPSDVKKAEEVEKGDIGRAARGLAMVGALASGAHSLSPNKPKEDVAVKPKQEVKRELASYAKPKPKKPEQSKEEKDKKDKAREAQRTLTREALKNKLKKALTAGYGGAGAPTDLTGGGVIQSEAMDDGRAKKGDSDEFTYVTCDKCGHEQVHMQYQVKCRKCRSTFEMSKLEGLL